MNTVNLAGVDQTKFAEKNYQQTPIQKSYVPKNNMSLEKDSFVKSNSEDKANNGKFDISECAKNFAKGVFSPLTALVKHPVLTVATVAATAGACALVPVLGPILGVAFGALSVYQLGKGVYDVAKNYKNGDYDKAEKSFNEVGQGTIGVATSALGVKQSAKIAKEAKLMSELKTTTLTQAQKQAIATEVKSGGLMSAIKEMGSLFTTKTGLKAVGAQFKPSNIAQRAKGAFKFLTTKEEVTKVKKESAEFKNTAEGKRRAQMTSEEIDANVKKLYKEAFDEYGIPEELRPEIEVIKDSNASHGGGYNAGKHKIEINENSYREGVFDLPDVMKHEATHTQKAILKQRLSAGDKDQIAKEYLIDKILNGDKENVITGKGNAFTGLETVKPPKMNAQMKADFAELAKTKLFDKTKVYSEDELLKMVKPLVESNKEFAQAYSSVDEAATALTKYAQSHQSRFQLVTNGANSGFNTSKIDPSALKPLNAQEKELAIQAFRDGIECLEGNGSNQKGVLSGLGAGDFDQYQFGAEEVFAQQQGGKFEISKLEQQLAKLKSSKNFDAAEEARLLDQIQKYKLNIEYKTKGEQMYKLYTKSLNNPSDKELASQVAKMKTELSGLQSKIGEINNLNDYSTYQVKMRTPMGSSVYVPYSTTVAADIVGDDLK